MTIRSRPATDEYRREWERVFGKGPELRESGVPATGRAVRNPPTLSPHDAEDHPEAD